MALSYCKMILLIDKMPFDHVIVFEDIFEGCIICDVIIAIDEGWRLIEESFSIVFFPQFHITGAT